ncbi:MAG: metallophosphoesterase family protein [Solirubrobacterales bacterium]
MNMKIAVISDIHGNSWALKEVMKDIKNRGITQIINLGDSLFGPLDPGGTFEILRNENIISIAGNQDRNMVEDIDKEEIHFTMNYVRAHINEEALNWLESLPTTKVFLDDFFLCHGTPDNDSKYLIEKVTEQGASVKSKEELEEELAEISQKVVLCGHSHIQRCINLNRGSLVLNPGSVGLPAFKAENPYYHVMESGSFHTRYSVVTREAAQFKVENIALNYDYKAAAAMAAKNNRPDWEKAILTGRA